ncbi:hypothetical protein BP6252_12052 [Coleophoma cylindrospora]|uniref:Uncharacterized protein n=1 Tax=Coleophoma cylindrospora TaxID=1849047 RepID=A0A3D8QFV1_9HELO|nr:hypothetical protein BP6252_12052 [Coleophoma cylindrospora]
MAEDGEKLLSATYGLYKTVYGDYEAPTIFMHDAWKIVEQNKDPTLNSTTLVPAAAPPSKPTSLKFVPLEDLCGASLAKPEAVRTPASKAEPDLWGCLISTQETKRKLLNKSDRRKSASSNKNQISFDKRKTTITIEDDDGKVDDEEEVEFLPNTTKKRKTGCR